MVCVGVVYIVSIVHSSIAPDEQLNPKKKIFEEIQVSGWSRYEIFFSKMFCYSEVCTLPVCIQLIVLLL